MTTLRRDRFALPAVQLAAAAAASIGAAEVTAILTRSPGLVDRTAEMALDLTPVPIIEWTIRNLGRWDKPLLRVGASAALCAAGAVARAVATTAPRRVLAAVAVTAGQLATTSRREATPWRRLIPPALVGTATHAMFTTKATHPRTRIAAAVTLGLTAAASMAHRRQQRHQTLALTSSPRESPTDDAETWPGLSPLITPIDDLFVTDTTSTPPAVDISHWQLQLDGLVHQPRTFTMAELKTMDSVDHDAVLCCIHNRLDTRAVGNVRWTGVPLSALLEPAKPSTAATHMIWRSADGWSAAMPIGEAIERGGIVAYAMNDQALTAAHGFPARVFIPGVYGQFAGAKWLQAIELAAEPVADYWTRKGWPADPVPVRPQARIDHPSNGDTVAQHCTVTGVAWAPPEGISTVEVSVDNGPWHAAELAQELAPTAWRRWRHTINLTPGDHQVKARATSRNGVIQDEQPRVSFPSGVSGHHQLSLHVD